jgi:hypothetical protein
VTVVLLKPQSLCPQEPTRSEEREPCISVPPGLLSPLQPDQHLLKQLLAAHVPILSTRPLQLYRTPFDSDTASSTQENNSQILYIQHYSAVRLRQMWTRQSSLLRGEHKVTVTIECTRREFKKIISQDEFGRIHTEAMRYEHLVSHQLVLWYRPIGTPTQKHELAPTQKALTPLFMAPSPVNNRTTNLAIEPPKRHAQKLHKEPGKLRDAHPSLTLCCMFRERYHQEYVRTLSSKPVSTQLPLPLY